MRFHALATDYDGTIAHDGAVDEATIAALERAKKSGRKLILVTGRELADLLVIFPRLDLFERAVIENGAVIFDPQTKETRFLAEAPPPAFAELLHRRGVKPLSVGNVIVATFEPHQNTVLTAIQELGLELQVIFNKGAVMVLPSGVNKATGLAAALAELGLSPHNTVGVGDAENDHAFMRVCECSAAVANALPAVKDTADIVTRGKRGAGVAEFIDRLIANDLSDLKTLERHRIPVGSTEGGDEFHLDPAGGNVLVCGTSGSGKSTLTTAMLERLADAGYQSLIVDPEGDYTNLEFAHILGNPQQAPRHEDVTSALRDPKRSVVVNLLGVPLAERPKFFSGLLPSILEVKARTGRPHWLVLDEAHHMLAAGPESAAMAPLLPDRGTLLITVHAGAVEPTVLKDVETLFVIGGQPTKTASAFWKATGERELSCPTVTGDKLPPGYALAWRRGNADAVIIHTKLPRTERKRHSRKYAEGNLGADRSFYFRGPEGKLNLKASNLFLFLQLADGVDDETWDFHRENGDYSSWAREQIKDQSLADELVEVEKQAATPKVTRAAMRAAIESRYTLPADAASGSME